MSLRVLALLGPNLESWTFLREFSGVDADAFAVLGPVSPDTAATIAPDLIVSYNHRHLVPPEVLAIPRFGAVNLHPAVLPYNRGAHPILWAVAEGTPLGVTVHRMDAGLDTGPILGQLLTSTEPEDTLESLYLRAHAHLRMLFWRLWPAILAGEPGTPQEGAGTFHRASDLARVFGRLRSGWKTPIENARERIRETVAA